MAGSTDTKAAWGTTTLRVALGVIFAAHGAQKLLVMGPAAVGGLFETLGIPFAAANAYLVIAVEIVGGIAMIAGLGARVVGALFAAVMLVAIATVHGAQGFFLPSGFEFNLVLLAASIAIIVQGAGAFALDNVLAGRQLGTRDLSAVRV